MMPPRLSASPGIHDHLCRHEIGSILTIGVTRAIALPTIKKLDKERSLFVCEARIAVVSVRKAYGSVLS
jgi:hypothetical protein